MGRPASAGPPCRAPDRLERAVRRCERHGPGLDDKPALEQHIAHPEHRWNEHGLDTSASVLRLVTIPISHYCEKARWALERVGIPYREERHVQGIHRFAARRAGGGITVPVLVTPDG